jgi:hypothetical protein
MYTEMCIKLKRRKNMILSNKTASAIALFLISAFAISLVAMPAANAHNPPYQITTYAKITLLPNPIGVGQSALGYAFLGNAPLSGAAITNTYRNHNYTVLITDPNGNVTTLHWDTVQDTTGVQFFRFTPDVVGQYNITFNYGGNVLNSTYFDTTSSSAVGDIWLPSSATCTLTVTEEPATTYPGSYPLPTQYWTRPIYGENQDWWTISSNWYGAGSPVISSLSSGTISQVATAGSMQQRYPGDAVGSLTSHVMWTKPLQEGGVVGGDRFLTQGDTYFEGSAYNNRFQNPIIMYGRLFYREPVSYTGTGSGDSICVDLRTGQEIWRRNDLPTISFGFTFDVQSPNQHGVYPAWLCTSNFARVYDMWTGENVFNSTGRPRGTLLAGTQGEYLYLNFENQGTSSNPDWRLTEWNSSRMFTGTGFAYGTGLSPNPDLTTTTTTTNQSSTTYVDGVLVTTLTPVTTTTRAVNLQRGVRYDWLDPNDQNLSLPWRNELPSSFSFSVVTAHYGDIMICRNGSYPRLTGQTQNVSGVVSLRDAEWTYFAINLNPDNGAIGRILWWSPTYSSPQDKTITWGGADPTARVFIEVCKETSNMVGYSYADGSKLWETNEVNALQQQQETPLDYFGNPSYPYVATNLAYGNIYSLSYGGILYCYNLTTGQRLWTNGNGNTPGNSTNTGTSVPGPHPAFVNGIGNDVIYTVATQHTTITPISKGQMARGINATDGTELWAISDYTGEFFSESFAMADGYCVWFNGYDNQIYSVGRGPSATTVSAPDVAAAFGTPVVIKGTVTDISAGTKQNQQAADFPNGVPCVSDASMTDWMGYVYQQKPLPADAVGVDVTLSVLDSNDNYRDIGTVTTDVNGFFHYTWTPEIPGDFTVYATFEGTNGYWPSNAVTAFTVMEAPEATPPPTAPPASNTDTYVTGFGIGIIIAIIAVGLVIVLVLRKR